MPLEPRGIKLSFATPAAVFLKHPVGPDRGPLYLLRAYSEPNPSAKPITTSTGIRANDKRKHREENLSSYVLSVSKSWERNVRLPAPHDEISWLSSFKTEARESWNLILNATEENIFYTT